MTPLQDKAVGAIAGAAVGDALGGATEGWTPEQIRERYDGWVTGIVPPYFADWRNARPIAPYHKGDGHVTDDTLMTHALIRVYERAGDHLDAYSAAEHLVPEMMGEKRWIPELEAEALPLQRVFLAEKWLVLRLHYGHVDPREAGTGNIVNCGAAMYMAPVGVVNAADPDRAYAEAVDLAGAHQSSYGREAAGVFAASVAEAMRPGATAGLHRRGGPAARQGRHPRRDRGGLRASARLRALGGLVRGPAGGDPPVRHGRRHLPRPGPGRAQTQPYARDRGAAARAGVPDDRRGRIP